MIMGNFSLKKTTFLFTILYLFLGEILMAQIGNQVTEIVTDFGGYWRSGVSNVSTVKPNNSHNLLAFTYDGVRYSTGVNDAALTTNGLSFVARQWYAVPVSSIPGTLTANTKLALGAWYDGVNPGASVPPPSAALSYYLTDGLHGLDIGTGVANLPIGQLVFDVSNLQINAIGNGVPDILITQIASPSSTSDRYSFRDANNNIVGNEVVISLTALNTLGNWTADFYETTPTRTLQTSFTNTDRPLRLWCTDLSAFGLNSSNFANVRKFVIQLSGDSDVGFVAYNSSAMDVMPPDLPGGVSKQPSLWLKANSGTNTMVNNDVVAEWADKSGNANNATQQTIAQRPIYRSLGANFNSTVNFQTHSMNTFQNMSNANGGAYTTFIVSQQNTLTTAKTVLGCTGTDASVRHDLSANNSISVSQGGVVQFTSSANSYGSNYRIWNTRYRGAAGNELRLDMTILQSNTNSQTYINRPPRLGAHQNASPVGNANISEVIVYPTTLTNTEVQRVSSYLAIKYGVTLPTDYLSCSGTVLFQADGPGGTQAYDYRIAGIGREICQQFNQRQSRSIATESLITIGAGKTIATDNISNTTIITDGSYLLTGDNNAAITWGSGTVGGVITSRIGRTWKASVTGLVDSVKIRIPASSSSELYKLQSLPAMAVPYLMVNTIDNFTSGYSTHLLTEVNGNYEVNYRFSAGNQFFTFGYLIFNPLPVDLVSFDAIPNYEKIAVDLFWVTESEINNDYFVIEKSDNGIDWRFVGRIAGSGSSNIVLQYFLHDPTPFKGISYYRLKQVDYDGTESFKGVRSVSFDNKVSFEVFPNPTSEKVYVKGEHINSMELYDSGGKKLTPQVVVNGTLWEVDTQNLPVGVYYLRIFEKSGFMVEKISVVR